MSASSWVHPSVPRRFRHVHASWSEMTFSERDAHKARLARVGDFAGLAFFEDWEDWRRSVSSPWRWKREGER